jgi:PleD family two-component response regulator
MAVGDHSAPAEESCRAERAVDGGEDSTARTLLSAARVTMMGRSNLSSRLRVLLVDADSGRREARGRRFQEASFDVFYATNAFEGFRLARRWQPDVVLLHTGVNGTTATELARRIALDPRTRAAEIVLTSENGVVGAFRVHEERAVRDVILVACRDERVLRLVSRGAGAP